MKLSIITVTWNSEKYIGPLIESIKQFIPFEYEIIVVDNNSIDQSVRIILEKYPQVKVIANKNNPGYATAMNQGYEISKGEYILYMNPDMKFEADVITPLLQKLESDKSIGAIAPSLYYEDGTIQPTVKRDPTLLSQVVILLKLHHLFKPKSLIKYLAKDFDYSKEQEVEQIMGAFILSTKERIDKFGGWDQDYPLWWEDVQLCRDVRYASLKIIYTPMTGVRHYEGRSAALALPTFKQKRFNKGMRLYFKKNHNFLSYLLLLILHPISLALAWLTQVLKVKPVTQDQL